VTHTALPRDELEQILNRFVEVNYAIRLETDGATIYRAIARLSDQ
jgi:hypothetical protein